MDDVRGEVRPEEVPRMEAKGEGSKGERDRWGVGGGTENVYRPFFFFFFSRPPSLF